MNLKTKAFTVMLVTVVVASTLIYLPLTHAVEPSEELEDELTDIQEFRLWRSRIRPKVRFVLWFLNNSEPVQVEGATVTISKNRLVMDTVDNQIRVILPTEWIIEGEPVNREELFASGYLSKDENITVKALGADVINKEGLSIYLIVGYEIINESGIHATANLPINIES